MATSERRRVYAAIAGMVFLLGQRPLLGAQQSEAPASQSSVPVPAPAATQPTAQDMADMARALGEVRQELKDERQRVDDLTTEVRGLRAIVASGGGGAADAQSLKTAVDQLHDDQEVVQSQVKTLQQTKVETESKYPVTLTGMVLFNSFVVDGAVDNPVLPLIAIVRNSYYTHHSLGASLQQTQIGLSATGPHLWGARSSADFSLDFFDQSNYTAVTNGGAMNLRLRTADVNLDWDNTQISAGLQTPLVSLLSPTSFATVGEPALSWSGNLWTWLPQITVERKIPVTGSSRALLGFGLIDPTTNDILGEQTYGWLRRSLQPGYEGRASYQWGDPQHPYEIGANGYYTRQLYSLAGTPSNSQALDFWAGTADWRLPVTKFGEFSGEFYRGRGIGDLGGGAFKNIVQDYDSAFSRGLDATGGWAQLKAKLNRLTEANVYAGTDQAESSEVRDGMIGSTVISPYIYLMRNRTVAANIIFRPRTYLVFSGEYRDLRSWYIYGPSQFAQTLNLTMGYIF